jgi:UDP-N-acetylmuramoylalanine--D-glutamate ligase
LTDWNGKKVTILGLGKTGHATAMYLARRQARVIVSEAAELKGANIQYAEDLTNQGVKLESGSHSDESLKSAELIITSPGIRPDADVIVRSYSFGKPVISDVELAFRESNIPIVAVTGTNGKSTTTALISFMLERNRFKAPACGNFGVPVLAALETSPDYIVIEISSFQLHYCQTFSPQVAVWLNLTPDHLDWHGGLDAYILAKRKLFELQKKGQFAVLNVDDKIVASAKTEAKKFPFSINMVLPEATNAAFLKADQLTYRLNGEEHVICKTTELQMIGRHNWENALAASSVGAVLGLDRHQIAAALKEFKGLEHRLEYVDDLEGIRCYNDSKATNTDSAIKALQAFSERVVLIAGGRDKGTDLTEFVECARVHTAAVILLGEAKERFRNAFAQGGVENVHSVSDLAEAIELGIRLKAGPLVLSPACASYDMFRDFEDRGNIFKDIVRSKAKKIAASAN